LIKSRLDSGVHCPWLASSLGPAWRRGFQDEVTKGYADFLGNRKERAINYSQFCYMEHLQPATGNT
jgi:hypothetical protein